MFKNRLKSHHAVGNLLDKYVKKEKIDKNEYFNILNGETDKNSKVMYIHIPFCDKICSFCNLNRTKLDNDLEDYTEYLLKNLREISETNYVKNSIFESIYFGGGTPSILKEHQLEKILSYINKNFQFHKEYEWTFETTIHNLNNKKIELFNKYGVNRFSIGIQTFSDKGREFLNRTFNKAQTIDKIKEFKKIFNGQVCADIIYNYQNQELDEVIEDARLIKELDLDSVSFYSLMIHEGSKLSKNNIKLSDDKRDYQYFKAFYDELISDKDWELLELTKFVKKNRDKYKYIVLRNNGADTLPIGIGAGGCVKNIGVFNMNKQMSFYIKQSSKHEKYSKFIGLLQFASYDFKKIKEVITLENFKVFMSCLVKFQKEELGYFTENSFVLTPKGVFWGNNMSTYICENLIKKEFSNVKENINIPVGHPHHISKGI